MKHTYQILGLLLLTLVIAGCSANAPQEPIDAFPEPIDMVPENIPEESSEPTTQVPDGITTEAGNTIIVDNLEELSLISSPLTITGKAPRKWYFEGIFPVSLLLMNGDEIVIVGATGPWTEPVDGNPELTGEDMIPFTATLEFSTPLGFTDGIIRLRADNPSGEAENDDIVEVPIQFQ